MSLEQMAHVWKLPVGATKPAGRLLLLALADIADDDGKCFPGRAYLARKCGLARNTIGIVMKRLTEAGYVTIEQRQRDDKTFSSNLYTLHVAPGACDDLPTPQHDPPRSQHGGPSYSSSIPQGTEEPPLKPPQGGPDLSPEEEQAQKTEEDARAVFDFHCQIMSNDPQKPRRWNYDIYHKMILKRLGAFRAAQLISAANNLSKSEWNRGRGKNPSGEHCDPGFLYRSDKQVDTWLNKA